MSFAPIESLLLLVDFSRGSCRGSRRGSGGECAEAGARSQAARGASVWRPSRTPRGWVQRSPNAAAATLEKRFFDATREPRWPEFAPEAASTLSLRAVRPTSA